MIQTYRITRVIEDRQLAYLEAMDIPVWVSRQHAGAAPARQTQPAQPQEVVTKPAAAPVVHAAQPTDVPVISASQADGPIPTSASAHVRTPGLKLGPGAGGVMMVCARDSDSASKLANDISRALRKMPVWAWPDTDEQGVSPAESVEENLFTSVAVFGEALGHLLFGDDIPASLGSAKLLVLPAMSELASSASARRDLWSVLCRSGMIVS